MKKLSSIITVAVATAAAAFVPAAAHAASTSSCTPTRPRADFYAGGRVASAPITDDNRACRTISVSRIRDAANPADRCQTFLVAFLSTDGRDPTYTEPVRACSPTSRTRTVLAKRVPVGVEYRVLYAVDYIEPHQQQVRFTVWH